MPPYKRCRWGCLSSAIVSGHSGATLSKMLAYWEQVASLGSRHRLPAALISSWVSPVPRHSSAAPPVLTQRLHCIGLSLELPRPASSEVAELVPAVEHSRSSNRGRFDTQVFVKVVLRPGPSGIETQRPDACFTIPLVNVRHVHCL